MSKMIEFKTKVDKKITRDPANKFVKFTARPFRTGGIEVIGYEIGIESDDTYTINTSLDELKIVAELIKASPVAKNHRYIETGYTYDMIGFSGDSVEIVEFNGESWIQLSLYLYNNDVVVDILAGMDQLSLGFYGTSEDINASEKTGSMSVKSINHIAIVEEGRVGDDGILFENLKGDKVGKIVISGKSYTVDDAVEAYIASKDAEITGFKSIDIDKLVSEKAQSMAELSALNGGKLPEGETYVQQLRNVLAVHFEGIDLSDKNQAYLEAFRDIALDKSKSSINFKGINLDSSQPSGLSDLQNYYKEGK